MTPKREAEFYILYLIDALDNATEKQYIATLKQINVSYASIKEYMQEYETEWSICVDLVEWILDEWANSQKENPKMSAKQFAKNKVSGFMSSLT